MFEKLKNLLGLKKASNNNKKMFFYASLPTCDTSRMGMNFEICSSAQKAAVPLGPTPYLLLQPIVLLQTGTTDYSATLLLVCLLNIILS